MATMNVSLPEAMKQWAEQQANTGRYSNTSNYVRNLIRRDQEQAMKIAHMQALVTEGMSNRTMEELRSAAKNKVGGQ